MKPVVARPAARRDIERAIGYYLDEGALDAADRLVDELHGAFEHLARHPGTGSPRYGKLLGLPGLRGWRLNDFPYLIFYIERPERVDVIRVLHGARDIAATLLDDAEPA